MHTDVPALDLLRSARKIGLVLSGGASRCCFQVGVIEMLEELGIQPALSVAVSGGAWNGAAVSAGTVPRLRHYWRAFVRMPCFDLRGILRDRTPYRFPELHRRTFNRYVGVERLRRPEAPPLWVGVTRLRDRQGEFFDARLAEDPLALCLASNYVPPFYTSAPRIGGERYGDGGMTNNLPYEKAFAEGCDVVVLATMKGESEGGLYRNPHEPNHVIPSPFRERVVVIRPRHRLPCGFTERRWETLRATMDLGRLRAREVILGERHEETEARAQLGALDLVVRRLMMTRVAGTAARRGKSPSNSPG
jgi:predicted acylesterase/phospholipase RssA